MLRERIKAVVRRSTQKSVEGLKNPSHVAERLGMFEAVPLALARSRGAMRLVRAAVAKELAPVAPTDFVPLLTLGAATLYRYVPARGAPAPTDTRPVLLCPSLINRPYILDLTDGNSLVQALHAVGRTVYTIDWGDPGDAELALDFSDFVRGRLRAFVDATNDDAQSDACHIVGHCLGGTMATALAATDAEGIASLANLTAPIDFSDDGMLATWCRMPFFDPAAFAGAMGHIPPFVTQPAFQYLRPMGMHTKMMRLFQNLQDERFLEFYRALETWVNDNVAIPKGFFVDLIVRLYRENALVSGTLVLAGERVDLANIKIPVLTLCAQKDNIVPPESARAGHVAYGSPHKEIEVFGGGHIGVVVGGAAKRRLWPRLQTWFDSNEPGAVHGAAGNREATATVVSSRNHA